MKYSAIFLSLGLMIAAQAKAETQIAYCGSGDAIGDVRVVNVADQVEIRITSPAEGPATIYRSNAGDVVQQTYDIPNIVSKLAAGGEVRMVLTTPNSITFGGIVSSAAVLSLRVHPTFSYDYNAELIYEGNVLALFCNQPGALPVPQK